MAENTVTVIAYENLKFGPNGDPVFGPEDWVVSGVFSTGMLRLRSSQGYAKLEDVQRMLELDGSVASIVGARADDAWRADALADSVLEALGDGRTWSLPGRRRTASSSRR